MKKITAIIALALVVGAGMFAQGLGRQQGGPQDRQTPPAQAQEQTVQVAGNLAYVNGWIAIQSGDKTYYLGGIQRLIGFVDGLKEGSAVKVEGVSFTMPMAPEYSFLRVTKVTVNGKTYDIPRRGGMGCGEGEGMGRQGRMGRGHMGRGFDFGGDRD